MGSKLSEALAVVSCIDADATSASTVLGDAVDLSKFEKVMYILSVGDMATSSTVDYAVWGCATSGGSYAAITGYGATQLTQAGTDADKQVIIEIDAQAAKIAGYNYVKDRVVVGTDAVDLASIGLGKAAQFSPQTDLASVDEIVAP